MFCNVWRTRAKQKHIKGIQEQSSRVVNSVFASRYMNRSIL